MFGSLLTSVPVELTFNDMRDAAARFSKQEVTTPVNLHSIVARTCNNRIQGIESLNPKTSDWNTPLAGKTVKRQVFDSSRCSDVSLGLSTSGLTRKKADGDLTKPHIFSHRLQLLRVLHGLWMEELTLDSFNAEATFKKLWKSSLFETGSLLRFTDAPEVLYVVLVAGPYCVSCLKVEQVEGGNAVSVLGSPKIIEIPVLDIKKVTVAATKPIALKDFKRLGWTMSADWITVPNYVANHTIWWISGTLLSALCTDIGLKGHTKLDHKRRAEMFMNHMGCAQEHVQEVLAFLPDKVVRKRQKKEN